MIERCGVSAWGLVVIVALQVACGGSPEKMIELQRVKSGALDIVLLSPRDAIRHGKDTLVIEFRSGGKLVDVGTVRAERMQVDHVNQVVARRQHVPPGAEVLFEALNRIDVKHHLRPRPCRRLLRKRRQRHAHVLIGLG